MVLLPTAKKLDQAVVNLTQLLDYLAVGGYALGSELTLQGPGSKITVVRDGAKHKVVRA